MTHARCTHKLMIGIFFELLDWAESPWKTQGMIGRKIGLASREIYASLEVTHSVAATYLSFLCPFFCNSVFIMLLHSSYKKLDKIYKVTVSRLYVLCWIKEVKNGQNWNFPFRIDTLLHYYFQNWNFSTLLLLRLSLFLYIYLYIWHFSVLPLLTLFCITTFKTDTLSINTLDYS